MAQLTKAWLQLRPHKTQSELWRTRARFVCLPSGRGSGKTQISKRRLAMYAAIDRDLAGERPADARGLKHLYAALGPTRQWVKRVWWDELKALIPKDWVKKISESDMIIQTIFNSEIHCIGMDKPNRFEGDQWDGVVEDEASDQKPNISLSIRPAIAYKKGWWWKIGIPKRYGTGAADYRKLCIAGKAALNDYEKALALGNHDGAALRFPELVTYSWPSKDIIAPEEVAEMQRRMDPKDFNEQCGGQWEQAGGAAFYNFDQDANCRPMQFDHNRPMVVSCDFNVTPMAWVIGQWKNPAEGDGLNIIDEIWINDTNTEASLNRLWERYGAVQKGGWHFFGDAASKQRHTSTTMSDYARILNDRRFKALVSFPESNPKRKDRLASCNSLLLNAAGQRRCHIDKRCEKLINDLENRGLESDGNPVDPKDANNVIGHISDAFGYVIHDRWPATVIEDDEATDEDASVKLYAGV